VTLQQIKNIRSHSRISIHSFRLQWLTSFVRLQIDFACDINGEVENPDVAQVSETGLARGSLQLGWQWLNALCLS
jgi:hypothetical protein